MIYKNYNDIQKLQWYTKIAMIYKNYNNYNYYNIKMASIYDLPYEDIEEFLLANNEIYDDENDAYNKSLELLKDKNAVGHTTSIIEWLTAHNLLIRNINIPNYTTSEINNLSQNEINSLAKLLTIKNKNVENIKHILKYLHKLDTQNKILLPETHDSIFNFLNELEINEINFDILKPYDIINLLETHRNKALIRKLIYDNMEKIIFYNYLGIEVKRLNDLLYLEELIYKLPKSIIFKLFTFNEKKLLKNHSKEINEFLNFLKESVVNVIDIDLRRSIENLVSFFVILIEINEFGLAKRVFDIANKYKLKGTVYNVSYSFNQYLITVMISQLDDVFNLSLELVGEKNFLTKFESEDIIITSDSYIKKVLNKLVKLKKYELLINYLKKLIIWKQYNDTTRTIEIVLPLIRESIASNNNSLIIKYIGILNLVLDGIYRYDKNRLSKITELIEDVK